MKRGHPVRIWSHLVSDLWRVRDTCGPTPENSWVSQQQGGRTGLLISHLSRFQYFQGRAVDLEKGQVSSPKSSRLSSQLLGWDVLKKDSEKVHELGAPNIMWQDSPGLSEGTLLTKGFFSQGLGKSLAQLPAWSCPRTRDSILPTVWFTFGALRVRKFFLC